MCLDMAKIVQIVFKLLKFGKHFPWQPGSRTDHRPGGSRPAPYAELAGSILGSIQARFSYGEKGPHQTVSKGPSSPNVLTLYKWLCYKFKCQGQARCEISLNIIKYSKDENAGSVFNVPFPKCSFQVQNVKAWPVTQTIAIRHVRGYLPGLAILFSICTMVCF